MVKNPTANAGDAGSIPDSRRSFGGGNDNPLLYSCLGNPWTEDPSGLQSTGSQRLGLSTQQTQMFSTPKFSPTIHYNKFEVLELSIAV